MSLRPIGGCLVLVGLLGSIQSTSTASPSNSATLPDAPVLNLRLTASRELPNLSRTALVKEADAIWRESGHLRLRWLTGDANPDTGMTLRVLVTPRAVASTLDGHRWAVGELLRFDRSGAIAVASITGAQRIVDQTQSFRLLDVELMSQHRLGVVLGRAVAHEIGHYVLRTNTHAPYWPHAGSHRRARVRRSALRIVPSRSRGPGTPRGTRDRHWRCRERLFLLDPISQSRRSTIAVAVVGQADRNSTDPSSESGTSSRATIPNPRRVKNDSAVVVSK